MGLLQPLPVPWRPWQRVNIDFITHLPKVQGYDAIMVVVDGLSKRSHFIPTHGTATAMSTAQLFYDTVWKHHGMPQIIVSDRDSKFTSGFWQTLWKLTGTQLRMSTAYSPQTDGAVERVNRVLEEMLRSYVNHKAMDWPEHLTACEYAYNDAVNETTGFSPFKLDTGRRDPVNPLHMFTAAANHYGEGRRVIQTVQDFLDQRNEDLRLARNALILAQQRMKQYHDTKVRPVNLKKGDRVWLSTRRGTDHARIKYPGMAEASSLSPSRIGPFKITEKVNENAFRLKLPYSIKIHPVVHARYLTLCKPSEAFTDSRKQEPEPPVTMDDGRVEYEVDKLVGKRVIARGRGIRTEYLVKWKGYGDEETSWEPLANLDNSEEAVTRYEAKLQRDQQQDAVAEIYHQQAHAVLACTQQQARWYLEMENNEKTMPSKYIFTQFRTQ